MKILQIASGDFFSTYGGGQVYVKNVVDEMIRQQLDVVVISFLSIVNNITRNSADSRWIEREYNGIKLYELNRKETDTLTSLIRYVNPTIIHAHSNKAIICEIGRCLGIPVIVTAHHGGIVCPVGTLLNCFDQICAQSISHNHCLRCVLKNTMGGEVLYFILRLIPERIYINIGKCLKKLPFMYFVTPIGTAALQIQDKIQDWNTIARGCSRIIAPCAKIAESMECNGISESKVNILPHGIPLSTRSCSVPKVEIIKFFYVGRICYVKGVHILLEAFNRIDSPNVELHLIGGSVGKYEKRYESKLKHKYQNKSQIIWHGKVKPADVFGLISNYHVGISPSICMEVYGLNIAEALAVGKPVIATRSGGAEMQIQNNSNGWLVEPNNVDDLYNVMIDLVNNPSVIYKMSTMCTAVSISEHICNLLRIYNNVVNKK